MSVWLKLGICLCLIVIGSPLLNYGYLIGKIMVVVGYLWALAIVWGAIKGFFNAKDEKPSKDAPGQKKAVPMQPD